ncbi:predicted protein [Aspergillus nidulans FGSC A4]|uniref:Uncharacterized protein n=1 Tax=Emericella nidulans (strain FGSC A4 / ATCC 38163 / CBS 112.46 / NRRL 194 / M139) TaxID=227321 RepID=Q5ASL9_EMENI|nr:hypothetical protein [Aspergillus nidulans FGSC A4]EAA60260.1 predicted protein [Aspergillus nidulans FGSC A4]CBF78185.1 TPA: conserved hypothetical protein [Aspergillus nidulans FGSC A4]|eukprot:XP_681980.1 predicted protein [Aspergillus nidulans FGSC A4]
MKTIGPKNLYTARFSPNQIISPIAHRYLTARVNPITPKIQYLCDNRDRNTLWWRVSVSALVSYKRVVRSWVARRARAAFKQELKERGFDAEGRRLDSSTPRSAAAHGFSGNMTGTLNIDLEPAMISATFPMIREEMKFTMNALIQEQQRKQASQQQPRKQARKAIRSPTDASVPEQPREQTPFQRPRKQMSRKESAQSAGGKVYRNSIERGGGTRH